MDSPNPGPVIMRNRRGLNPRSVDTFQPVRFCLPWQMKSLMYPYSLRPPLILEALSTFSRRHFHIFFSLFSSANNGANKAWHYIWTVCWADDSHEKFSLLAVKYWKQIGICSKIFNSAPEVQAVFLAAAARANLQNNRWMAGISDLRREAW